MFVSLQNSCVENLTLKVQVGPVWEVRGHEVGISALQKRPPCTPCPSHHVRTREQGPPQPGKASSKPRLLCHGLGRPSPRKWKSACVLYTPPVVAFCYSHPEGETAGIVLPEEASYLREPRMRHQWGEAPGASVWGAPVPWASQHSCRGAGMHIIISRISGLYCSFIWGV